jgi:hypothetical protein
MVRLNKLLPEWNIDFADIKAIGNNIRSHKMEPSQKSALAAAVIKDSGALEKPDFFLKTGKLVIGPKNFLAVNHLVKLIYNPHYNILPHPQAPEFADDHKSHRKRLLCHLQITFPGSLSRHC